MSSPSSFELRFSPKGGCAEKLVEIINDTNSTIRAMVYGATLEEVSKGLIQAGREQKDGGRGVNIQMVLDKRQTYRDQAKFYDRLEKAGKEGANIEVRLYSPGGRACMHHKVGIFDGETVMTGSFNWTKNAEKNNNENLIAIRNPEIVQAYAKVFDELWKAASPEGRYRRIRRFGRFVLSQLPISGRYYPPNQ